MRRIAILILISLYFATVLASQSSGEIKFDRRVYYTKIINALPYLSQEEKDRQKLTWGKDEGWAFPYVLRFSPDKSIYTYGEKESEYTFSWKQDEYLLIHNLKENRIKHQLVAGGKLYLVEDNTQKYSWKIHNEIREVAGYLCMKAETRDTIKNQTIYAWFTTEIPISDGPEGFYGLPGMILMLEINDGTAIIEATEVNLDEKMVVEEPAKIKGKTVAMIEYQDILQKYFKQSIERERNPYWQLRY